MKKTRKIAVFGLLIALALVFSYIESRLPIFFAVPGMKLGLTNIVVLFSLYLMGAGAALTINFIRIIMMFLLFGNMMGLIYSLAGGLLSTLVMICLRRVGKFKIVTVSIMGGITHNIGQIIVAMVLLQTTYIAWYLVVLWFSGIISGAVIGVIGMMLYKRLGTFLLP